MELGTLAIRGTVGPLFVGHGTQKLFGWFGGHGVEGTGGFFETLGLRPGQRHARAAGLAEAAGGALLTLGALTPLAATLVTSTMVTAIRKAHAKQGPWVTDGGYEYNAVLIAAMAAVAERGAGSLALDGSVLPAFRGRGWALAAIAGGVAGSYLATSKLLNDPAPAENEGTTPVPGDPAAEDRDRFTRDDAAVGAR